MIFTNIQGGEFSEPSTQPESIYWEELLPSFILKYTLVLYSYFVYSISGTFGLGYTVHPPTIRVVPELISCSVDSSGYLTSIRSVSLYFTTVLLYVVSFTSVLPYHFASITACSTLYCLVTSEVILLNADGLSHEYDLYLSLDFLNVIL